VAHAGALRAAGGDDLTAEFIQNDWRKADLTEAERAMLEYAEKLTIAPASMTEEDVERLRAAGWTDRDILDIVQVCAYFNFRVRIVDGLGLKVSDQAAERAWEARQRAAALAEKKGVALPADRWDIAGQAATAKR
jgi:uncharacterized peroxidase-related enzyme